MFRNISKYQFNLILFIIILLTLNFSFFIISDESVAAQALFEWEPITEPDLAGYRLFYREQGQSYDFANPLWEGTNTYCTIYDLDASKTHFIVVKVFNNAGYESENSNEVSLEPWMMFNKPPTAVVTQDYIETTEDSLVTLDGSASTDSDDGIASYLWTQVEGDPVSLSNPTSAVTTFTTPRTESFDKKIEFILTVTDRGGLKDTADSSIYVMQNETPTLNSVTVTGPAQVNESSGAPFTLTANYSDGNNNDVTNLASWSENSSYAGITSYGFLIASSVESDQSCTIMASYGSQSDTHNIIIDDVPHNNSPVVDFRYDSWRKLVRVIDRSTDSDGTIVSRLWDFGDGKYDTRKKSYHKYSEFGIYSITLTVTDNEGVSSSISKSVSITR